MKDLVDTKVTFKDVFGYFWNQTSGSKIYFWTAIFSSMVRATVFALVPVYIKKIFDLLVLHENKTALFHSLILLFFTAVGIRLIGWLGSNISFLSISKLEATVMPKIKRSSLKYIINHSYDFFSNTFVGSLVHKVNKFSKAYEIFVDRLIMDIVPITVQLGTIAYIVGRIDILFSVLFLGLAIMFLFVNILFARVKKPFDISANEIDSKVTGLLADTLTNHNTVSLFSAKEYENELFLKETSKQEEALWKKWGLGSILDGIQNLIIIGFDFCILYYSIYLWKHDRIDVSTIVMFQLFMSNLSTRLWDLGRVVRHIYEAYADSYEMMCILKKDYSVKDPALSSVKNLTQGVITFNNISFGYSTDNPVFKNFSLSIPKGEKVAFVGSSGAGKTTIIKLLLRLYDVQGGNITIDGHSIKDISQDVLHNAIAVVSQDPILFHRTLMENIRYGRRDATDEEVYEAARRAHADEFIRKFPEGYNTFVGERGVKLSGGERQRVAIARALLKNAPILLLDEATSALDSESERLIQDAFKTLMKGRTSIVIAHRLSTIRDMDRIVVIENGDIIEDGSHEVLLQKEKGMYAKLWNMQAGGFIQ